MDQDEFKFSSQDSFVESWNCVAQLGQNDSFTQLMTSNPIIEYHDGANTIDEFQLTAESITMPDTYLTSSIHDLFGLGNLDGVLNSQEEQHFDLQSPEQQQNLMALEQAETDVKPVQPIIELPDSTHGSMIPSNTNYPGKYGFNLLFKEQSDKMTKSTSFTYSEALDKLFINMGASCIVYFKVDEMPENGCVIRALPIFEKAEHVREVVRRCPTHCLPTDASNYDHIAPDHLIRCDNDFAQYNVDAISNRLSVTVPFVPPQVGTEHTSHLYKFMCFGSCVGGLNRRPIMLIFTLEKDGKVLGRRSLRVRICACPGRDRKTEEKQLQGGSTRRNPGTVQTVTSELVVCGPASKRVKGNDGDLIIYAKSRTHYEILKKIQESLELADLVPIATRERYQKEQLSNDSLIAGSTSLRQRSNVQIQPLPVTKSSGVIQGEDPLSRNGSVLRSCEDVPADALSNGIGDGNPGAKVKQEKFYTIASWLESIRMAAYVDIFAEKGFSLMSQLDEWTEEDMKELRIGEGHRNVIWISLLRHSGRHLESGLPLSQASTCSTSSSRPPLIQVTRYRFKKVCSLTKDSYQNE